MIEILFAIVLGGLALAALFTFFMCFAEPDDAIGPFVGLLVVNAIAWGIWHWVSA